MGTNPSYTSSGIIMDIYYTSQAIISGHPHQAGSLPNIPAHEIERVVQAEIMAFCKDDARLQPWLQNETLQNQETLLKAGHDLHFEAPDQERLFFKSLIRRVELSDKSITIELSSNALIPVLRGKMNGKPPVDAGQPIMLMRPIKLAATKNGSKVVVGSMASGKNTQLLKAIARSFLWNEQLLSGEKRTMQDIATGESISSTTYIARVMRLRFLAPDIIESILEGTQPADWTVEKLFAIQSTNWQEQRIALGLI
jgi:hypothetical protein